MEVLATVKVSVREQDSLWKYSQLFQVPLPLIIDSNPGVDPNRLMIGQTIDIPGYIISEYTIAPGDTLGSSPSGIRSRWMRSCFSIPAWMPAR